MQEVTDFSSLGLTSGDREGNMKRISRGLNNTSKLTGDIRTELTLGETVGLGHYSNRRSY